MSSPAAGSTASRGLPGALRALVATLGGMLHVRGALLVLEMREEVLRRGHMLSLVALAAVFLHLGLILIMLLVVVAFWDTHRLAAIATLAGLCIAAGAAALIVLRAKVATAPAAFGASRDELARDIALWRLP